MRQTRGADDSILKRGQEQGGRAREIVDAAIDIFWQRGYSEASVQDVADAVGLLKGSLYHYMRGKDDLLFFSCSEFHAQAFDILERVKSANLPPIEAMDLYVRLHVELHIDNVKLVSVYYREARNLSPERRKQIVAERADFENFVVDLIAEGQRDGSFDASIDSRLAAFFILGALNRVHQWYREDGPYSREDVLAVYTQMCRAAVVRG